jgi:hypothetical protein
MHRMFRLNGVPSKCFIRFSFNVKLTCCKNEVSNATRVGLLGTPLRT